MARWKLRLTEPAPLSLAALEPPASPPASPGLLDLHAALEEMAQLSALAEKAEPSAPSKPKLLPGEVTEEGPLRLVRLTGQIQVVIEEVDRGNPAAAEPAAAPVEVQEPLSSAWLPADCRASFEILNAKCPRPWAEAFRKLRGRLLEEHARWHVSGRRLGSLAVLSPRRGGGRSATARNLAACLGAMPESRVLLVDADAGRPGLHKRLRIPQSPGLADAIGTAGSDWRRFVHRVPDSGIYVLPLGSARAGIDALDYTKLQGFLDRACQTFTWVIVDAPPMETADGEAVSSATDGSIMVLRNQREYFDEADAAVRRLDPSRLVGAILNFAG